MDGLERLNQLEALKGLKARYCRYCDNKDWDNFLALFTKDAVFDVRTGASPDGDMSNDRFTDSGLQVGIENISAFVLSMSANIISVHHCHTPEIEIKSDTTATGIWAMEDRLQFSGDVAIKSLHGFGHYNETYERVDGTWLIKTLRLSRLRVDLA
jgi:hypothetical protein